ncbi:hypothetical protein WT83_16405 [Burkholderia territorii]|uniref:Alpha/beta hydrolase n=1 Tax=Burkholderia territorii TaxID=1503055 RepID=A0A108ENN6_9BURK|nr:hypothetical protein [Burkholderia territorii]KWN14678.1 hypothetical protein WT83_16405 [Burkholderia territorii]
MPVQLAPLFVQGFGTGNLVRNAYGLSMLEDQIVNPDGAYPAPTAIALATSPAQPLRQAFKRNDLRNWVPRAPVLLCGGQLDPMVFFFNAADEQAYWKNANFAPGLTRVLDVDSAPGGNDLFASIKTGFAQAKQRSLRMRSRPVQRINDFLPFSKPITTLSHRSVWSQCSAFSTDSDSMCALMRDIYPTV